MNTNRIWILGAPDPEMEMIETLLRDHGEEIIYATGEDGRRVHPGNAYRCPTPEVPEDATVYAVECIDSLPHGWTRIDHHRPGDPGYGRPPENFMAASSIGQVIERLAQMGAITLPLFSRWGVIARLSQYQRCDGLWETDGRGRHCIAIEEIDDTLPEWPHAFYPDDEIILTSAADHCLAAAYRGECPGVDPDALMRWRAKSRAKFQGRPVEDVLADIEAASEELRDAQPLWCVKIVEHRRVVEAWEYDRVRNGQRPDPDTWYRRRAEALDAVDVPRELEDVLDLRHAVVPELPEAASREGVAYLATVTDRDGREKVVLGGCTTPEVVRAFMEQWAPAQGLVDIYGDSARGFAGGYLP